MSEELKQAAQQALEACPFCGADPQDAHHIEYGRWAVTCRCGASGASANTGPNATDAAKIKAYSDARHAWNNRALTQRPAARADDHGEQLTKAKRLLVDLHKIGGEDVRIMIEARTGPWFVWGQDRASLPTQPAAQAMPSSADDMAVYDGIADGYFADTQQATPEPVGEPVAWHEKLTGRLCEPEDAHRRKFPMCYEPLYTRPAPGVTETDADALLDFMEAHRVSVTPEYEGQWCARQYDDEPQAVAEFEAATPRDAIRALAAAQAKGADK